MPIVKGQYRRPQLRNGKVNYRFGWFFVTFQVAENKSELGAIVGDTQVLNALGSLASREYRRLKSQGLARDIGSKLWQANYWEKIVTKHEQLEAIRAYVANNPKKWSIDRFGPVTAHSLGNLELLNEPFVAFVASQDARAGDAGHDSPAPQEYRPRDYLGERGCYAPLPPVISTFTSPQERAMLRRLIASSRRFIAVYPGGLPAVLPREIAERVAAGAALLLSPVEPGTGVNKQRAVWCNEYVIMRASRVWCGAISPGGTLEAILKKRKKGR